MAATKLIKLDPQYHHPDTLEVGELYLCETYQGRWYTLRYKGINFEMFSDGPCNVFELDEFLNFKLVFTDVDIRNVHKLVGTVKDRDYDEWIKEQSSTACN